MSSLGRTDKLGKAPPQPECAHCGIRFNGVQACTARNPDGQCQTAEEMQRTATERPASKVAEVFKNLGSTPPKDG